MVDVVTAYARESVLSELLTVLMSEMFNGLRNKFIKWKEAIESKGLKVNIGQWGRMKSCDEVETARGFTYRGDRVSAGGGCEASVTARRCGWVRLKECVELLYCRRFPLKQKGAVNKSYLRPAVLY